MLIDYLVPWWFSPASSALGIGSSSLEFISQLPSEDYIDRFKWYDFKYLPFLRKVPPNM